MRIERVDAEIRKELAALIDREIKDPRINDAMIGVLRVETTADLRYAKVFVSIAYSENPAEVLKTLKQSAGYLRKELFGRLKIRAVPELVFVKDESIDYGMKIEGILKTLDIKPDDGDNK